MQKIFKLVILFMILASSATYAEPEIGLPMIFIIWPAFWLALIPIILIESMVFYKLFKQESFKQFYCLLTVANLFSTFIIIPLTWGGLWAIELLVTGGKGYYPDSMLLRFIWGGILQAPWLIDYRSDWMVPIACLVLFIPMFLMSVWGEGLIYAKMLKKAYSQITVKKALWRANMTSFAIVYLTLFMFMAYKIIEH